MKWFQCVFSRVCSWQWDFGSSGGRGVLPVVGWGGLVGSLGYGELTIWALLNLDTLLLLAVAGGGLDGGGCGIILPCPLPEAFGGEERRDLAVRRTSCSNLVPNSRSSEEYIHTHTGGNPQSLLCGLVFRPWLHISYGLRQSHLTYFECLHIVIRVRICVYS